MLVGWLASAPANAAAGAGTYTLVNAGSGLCLDLPGSSAATGVQLDQATCDNTTGQRWVLDATGAYASPNDASFTLVNLGSGLLAEVFGNATAAGAEVDQWTGNGGANQTWNFS